MGPNRIDSCFKVILSWIFVYLPVTNESLKLQMLVFDAVFHYYAYIHEYRKVRAFCFEYVSLQNALLFSAYSYQQFEDNCNLLILFCVLCNSDKLFSASKNKGIPPLPIYLAKIYPVWEDMGEHSIAPIFFVHVRRPV